MRKRHVAFLFGPAVLLLVLYAVWGTNAPRNSNVIGPAIQAADIRVIDGDTIEWGGVNYRLMGFDAPETLQAGCEAERAMGEATTSMLRSLILGSHKLTIEVQPGTDKYGRGLARLIVDGENVGDRLISQRLAHPYDGGARQPWCE